MKVRELIEKLKAFDPEMEALVDGSGEYADREPSPEIEPSFDNESDRQVVKL